MSETATAGSVTTREALAPAGRLPVPQPAPFMQKRRLEPGLSVAISAALERRRLIVLVPFAIIAGLLGYVLLPAEPSPVLLVRSNSHTDRSRSPFGVATHCTITRRPVAATYSG